MTSAGNVDNVESRSVQGGGGASTCCGAFTPSAAPSCLARDSTMFTPLFHSLLKFYHLFPLHSPVTLLYMDAPWGKFAYNEQRGREGRKAWGDLDGNLAWAFMEIVSVSLALFASW